jgi:iron complex transport system substrate-binding protein
MQSVRIAFFVLLFFFISCSDAPDGSRSARNDSTQYATGFEIHDFGRIKKITVFNPWEKASGISFSYYLIPENQSVPDSLKNKRIIFTPVERVVCLSTSHIAFIGALGEEDKIRGVSGSRYISHPEVAKKIASGEIVDVGYDNNLNYERILQQDPDLVMVYGVNSEVTAYVRKMEDLGLNVFYVAEYLEKSPLGRAEWIKAIAPLFEKTSQADSFFTVAEKNYEELKRKAKRITPRPRVLVGLPYRDSWWIPGGESYLAHLIEDAGGNYIGKENNSRESYVISFENALAMAHGAEVWINTGSVDSREEILAADERFASFPSFNNARIYNNNNRMSLSGGNDFWESGTIYPDKILHDFIVIFHPGLLGNSELYYYREIK